MKAEDFAAHKAKAAALLKKTARAVRPSRKPENDDERWARMINSRDERIWTGQHRR